MVAKDHRNPAGSPKAVVGEIDTSAPFQSVKDAVTLFGEGAFSGERPSIKKPQVNSAQRVLAKESQLHLAQKELDRLKQQVKNAETTKAQVVEELERAKRAVEDLTLKLHTVSQSRELAIKQIEIAKDKAKHLEETNSGGYSTSNGTLKPDLESFRKQYSRLSIELDSAKHELNKVRQESNAVMESKLAAFRTVEEANEAIKGNFERADDLSKEISVTKDSIEEVKLGILHSQQEQAKIFAEKAIQRQSCKAALEVYAKKLLVLKNEFDPELATKLEAQLAEATNEIGSLKEQMGRERASNLEVVKSVTFELDESKSLLMKIAEEETSLRSMVESLKEELEKVKKEHSELKEKEAETESIVGNLHVKLRKSRSELEACLDEESKARGASEEMLATLQQLSLESKMAHREAEDMKSKAEERKKEAEAARAVLMEAESSLRTALEEAEAAKAAEASALGQIKSLSERTTTARASMSESGNKITISQEEFESLSRKVKESDSLAEMKVAAALAQVEAFRASEYEALKKLEATRKEIEATKVETEAALKRAEMAEAAKRAVEGELRRWREREQKKAAEAASRILANVEKSYDAPSPQNFKIQKPTPAPLSPEKIIEVRKLEKEKTVSKKALMPNISGIFNRKKNQVEGGSLSYLPGEKPV
ncbi:hypothetical protein MLD38_001905 [Melastoma candidum]|uniref:Uncharacterized protein n=1 Tax=Melastoma candidum TaxID=119954 RepID=A0ACB9SFP7_9MYRT|nr:hypothetical protein MLD38_001905 [Melastoma candidum]